MNTPNFNKIYPPPCARPWEWDSTDYNPYALEMVPFSAVDPNDFYTMSVHGTPPVHMLFATS